MVLHLWWSLLQGVHICCTLPLCTLVALCFVQWSGGCATPACNIVYRCRGGLIQVLACMLAISPRRAHVAHAMKSACAIWHAQLRMQTSACHSACCSLRADLSMPTQRSGCAQVAVYNYMKLKMIQAKAALSTGKDAEKGGGAGGLGQAAPQLTADARSPTASAPAAAQAASADYTSFRRAACPQGVWGSRAAMTPWDRFLRLGCSLAKRRTAGGSLLSNADGVRGCRRQVRIQEPHAHHHLPAGCCAIQPWFIGGKHATQQVVAVLHAHGNWKRYQYLSTCQLKTCQYIRRMPTGSHETTACKCLSCLRPLR